MYNRLACLRRYCVAVAFVTVAALVAFGAEPVDPGVGDPYPLAHCAIVPDVLLDENAEIVTVEERELRVCCSDCADQLAANSFGATSQVDERITKQQLPLYPLTTCIVDDKPLFGLGTVNYVFRNRLFRVCSGKCQVKLEQEPAKFFGKLDYAVIEKQKPDYPLTTCIVSGKPLAADSLDHVVANQLVRLSSFDQLEQFGRTPGGYLLKLRQAAKKNAPTKGE
jgi:hypothetical protein